MKRAVRARQKLTGEPYNVARRRVMAELSSAKEGSRSSDSDLLERLDHAGGEAAISRETTVDEHSQRILSNLPDALQEAMDFAAYPVPDTHLIEGFALDALRAGESTDVVAAEMNQALTSNGHISDSQARRIVTRCFEEYDIR